jgi:serine/threonine protein kinase
VTTGSKNIVLARETRYSRPGALSERGTVGIGSEPPNICTIYDVGEADGKAFIAMEFLDGTTLRSISKTMKFSGADIARNQGNGKVFDSVWTFTVK